MELTAGKSVIQQLCSTPRLSTLSLLSQATKDGVDQLKEHQDDQERQQIVNWLSPIVPVEQQINFTRRRQQNTGQWFLNTAEFRTWLDGTGQTLLCTGIPGVGKTTIASLVIDELCETSRSDRTIGVTYLYCGFKGQHEQTLEVLVATLLRRLLHDQSDLPHGVEDLYKCHVQRGTRPSFCDIMSALLSTVRSFSKVFFVIDALDECTNADGRRHVLMDEIAKLQGQTGAKLFATSRHVPEVMNMELFRQSVALEVRASDEDVRSYLHEQMRRERLHVRPDRALQDIITTRIIKAADGM